MNKITGSLFPRMKISTNKKRKVFRSNNQHMAAYLYCLDIIRKYKDENPKSILDWEKVSEAMEFLAFSNVPGDVTEIMSRISRFVSNDEGIPPL